MSTIWVFDSIENKYTLYRGEECMKNICNFLREHATNAIRNNKMLPLTKKEFQMHQD